MNQKEKCNNCQRGWDKNSAENWYIIKYYHEQARGEIIWACSICYATKQQEYLKNYQVIYRRFLNEDNDVDYKVIKGNIENCYDNSKDKNGRILWQENCLHCQPWKYSKNKEKYVNCGEEIGDTKYFGNDGKFLCSMECVNTYNKDKGKPQQQNPPKNNNKGLSTEFKGFLGMIGAIIVLVIGIMVVRISRKTKK